MNSLKSFTLTLASALLIAQALTATSAQTKRAPALVVQTGHSDSVSSVTFSPDGKILASISNNMGLGSDYAVRLWEAGSGKELKALDGHSETVRAVAFHPDGKTLASGGWDKTIRIWDVESGRTLRTLKGHTDAVFTLAFSPDGRLLASGSKDETVKLWDAEKGIEVLTLPGHSQAVLSTSFSRDGRTLASGSWDKTIRLWDVDSGTEVGTLTGHSAPVSFVCFTPDDKTFVSAAGGEVKFWDVESRSETGTAQFDAFFGGAVALSPDGKTLAMVGSTVELRDIESGATWTLAHHYDFLNSVTFSPDGKTVASGSHDHTIRLWNVESGEEIRTLRGYSSRVHSLRFSPDGKTLAFGTEDNAIKLWDLEAGKMRTLSGHGEFVSRVRFSPDGRTLASMTGTSADLGIRLWDVKSGKELRALPSLSVSVMSFSFSPDGGTLAAGYWDNTIKLWDVASGKPLRTLSSGNTRCFWSVAFSPDGRMLASGSDMIKLWDVASGKEVRTLPTTSTFVQLVTFSPDGKTLASLNEYVLPARDFVQIWDVDKGTQLESLDFNDRATAEKVLRLFPNFEPYSLPASEKLVALTTEDAKVTLYDRKSRRELATLIALDKTDWVVITPDGRFDTNKLERPQGLHWVLPDVPLRAFSFESFMRDYSEPNLLQRVLRCNEGGTCGKEFKAIRNLSALNRTQPRVSITQVEPASSPGAVEVSVEVEDGLSDYQKDGQESASSVYDVRLFRDGQLVGHSTPDEKLRSTFRPYKDLDEELAAWREANSVAMPASKRTFTFEVRLPNNPDNGRVEFSTYAFNEDRVKSETARMTYTIPAHARRAPEPRRAYIIAFGVNKYDNPEWELRFAANDARAMSRTVSANLRAQKEFSEVVEIPLISDSVTANGKTLDKRDATKGNVQTVLELLSGKAPPAERLKDLEAAVGTETLRRIQQATPDDLILIFFSSHGYADRNGIFYIVPSDIGKGGGKRVTVRLLSRSISSDELSLWLRDVDAGEIVMIVDACHAASAVEGGEFKPGPMGSRGLGQLAFDKGMKILAATQADNIALEVNLIRQGLLTYALIRDGIEARQADYNPKDNVINLGEWLSYGVERVPRLYEEVRSGNARTSDGMGRQIKFVTAGGEARLLGKDLEEVMAVSKTQQPLLFDFTRKKREVILSVLR